MHILINRMVFIYKDSIAFLRTFKRAFLQKTNISSVEVLDLFCHRPSPNEPQLSCFHQSMTRL
jgi:hypothetical protein